MVKPKIIYKDLAGNKLYRLQKKNIVQYFGKNREGKIVTPHGVNVLAKKAGLKIGKVTQKGIQRVRYYGGDAW